MKKKVRILIADDHEIVRRGIRPLIESEWGWEVCGEARTGGEAVAMAEKLKPDVVVLDVAMPEVNGVDATRQIKAMLPETEVLVFTGTESEALVHEVFAAGARGCVLKSDAAEHLIPGRVSRSLFLPAISRASRRSGPRLEESVRASARSCNCSPKAKATRKSRPSWGSV
jgi:DNA-binding NarL/FixJ family response regulator